MIPKDTEDMDSFSNQQGLTNNARTQHPIAVEYIFSKTHGIFSKIYHMLDVKQATRNLKGLISYRVCSLTIVQLNWVSKKVIDLENSQIWGNETINYQHKISQSRAIKEIRKKLWEGVKTKGWLTKVNGMKPK